MSRYSLEHLADATLLSHLSTLVARGCENTADVLAHLAEVDERRLHLPAGYPSMYAYCVGRLHLSEDAACKRIHAARTARRFPALFDAVATNRLNLTGVVLLAPHLTAENADELVAEATHKTKSEIQHQLARRFPQPDLPTRLEALSMASSSGSGAKAETASVPGRMPASDLWAHPTGPVASHPESAGSEVPPSPDRSVPGRIAALPRPRVTPLASERYALQVTIGKSTHDLLRQAQALLAHRVPASDVEHVLERALRLLVRQLEKSKFGAADRPRSGRPSGSSRGRHIPADVKRAVRDRDGDRCTFVSDSGHRCESRSRLEYDHVLEVARGGPSTIGNLRLRCWAHNQYGAARTFGIEFMRRKREQARSDANRITRLDRSHDRAMTCQRS